MMLKRRHSGAQLHQGCAAVKLRQEVAASESALWWFVLENRNVPSGVAVVGRVAFWKDHGQAAPNLAGIAGISCTAGGLSG